MFMSDIQAAYTTREDWLNAFMQLALPVFESVGSPIPDNVRVSVGFPSHGMRGKAIGQCFSDAVSRDGHFEIFIHPNLQGDTSYVASTLTHELVHAAVGLKAGHGVVFKRCAVALGLGGKMTATVATAAWHDWADDILKQIGDMPGASLDVYAQKKKQTTRMIKFECGECGFTLRTSAKWADACQRCPDPECGGAMQEG